MNLGGYEFRVECEILDVCGIWWVMVKTGENCFGGGR